ncbi:MAG: hypothetical protein ABR529_01445 [Actinomycetota bacterium]
MEIEGHPTLDLLEELERRGALRLDGTTSGPHEASVRFLSERLGDKPGLWLFLPHEAFETGFDEPLA